MYARNLYQDVNWNLNLPGEAFNKDSSLLLSWFLSLLLAGDYIYSHFYQMKKIAHVQTQIARETAEFCKVQAITTQLPSTLTWDPALSFAGGLLNQGKGSLAEQVSLFSALHHHHYKNPNQNK